MSTRRKIKRHVDRFITHVEYGRSGKLLLRVERRYRGPWALLHNNAVIDQASYAFYLDGTETGSVIIGSPDNQQNLSVDTIYQCRVLLQDQNTGVATNVSTQWEYNLAGGGWIVVTTTSSVVIAVSDGGNTTDGADCTQRLGSGTFITDNDGVTHDGTGGGSGNDFIDMVSDESEQLLIFQIVAGDVSDGQELLLRCTPSKNGGTVLDADINVSMPSSRRIFIT